MKKMIAIAICEECPHYAVTGWGKVSVCMMVPSDGGVAVAGGKRPIPEWCPLPDYPEEKP